MKKRDKDNRREKLVLNDSNIEIIKEDKLVKNKQYILHTHCKVYRDRCRV